MIAKKSLHQKNHLKQFLDEFILNGL